jgi:hypothetical protein
MTLRRSVPLKPSRGTTWPHDVAAAIRERDRHCVGPKVGMVGTCYGSVEIDHVRASHGIGMKSSSTEDNGVLLCSGIHHRMKTEGGKVWRPRLLRYLEKFYGRSQRP